MDKLKKIFSGSSDKEAAREGESAAKSYGKKSIDSGSRSTGATSTGIGSSTAGDSSSYEKEHRGLAFVSPAERELSTSGTKDINRPFAKDEPLSVSGGDTIGSNTATSGNLQHSDTATTASIKSGVQGTDLTGVSDSAHTAQPTTTEYSSSGAGMSGAGLTGTALTDRSVEPSSSMDYATTSTGDASAIPASGGPHLTFTGNRLDPAFNEDIPSYHEEVAEAHKHKPTGHVVQGPTGMAATYTITGAEAQQYAAASSISTIGYGGQSYGSTGAQTTRGLGETYETSSTGPASDTIGPHSSNAMNVLDPRVQPDPAMMKGEKSSRTDYESDKPAAVRRYEEDTGTSQGQSYQTSGGTAGAAGVVDSQYPIRDDLDHHEAVEDRNRRHSKGGVFGIIHSSQRDKYDDPAERNTSAREKYFGQHSRGSVDFGQDETSSSSHVGRDVAAIGTAGGLGTAAAYEYEQHREPTMTTGMTTGEYDPYSSERATTTTAGATGVYDPYATEASTGPAGFATGYTGDSRAMATPAMTAVPVATTTVPTTTTTTYSKAPVAAAPVVATPEKKHHFGFLHRKEPNKLHKDPPRGIDDAGDGRVIDSVTGLPMNVAKYGSGAGGTDGLKSIQGYEKGLNSERLATEGTADYEAIHKANVPY